MGCAGTVADTITTSPSEGSLMAGIGLVSELRRHFGSDARVEERVNDTGFANKAFTVEVAGGRVLWVKVSPSASANARLDSWATVAEVLEERYWAPPLRARPSRTVQGS